MLWAREQKYWIKWIVGGQERANDKIDCENGEYEEIK